MGKNTNIIGRNSWKFAPYNFLKISETKLIILVYSAISYEINIDLHVTFDKLISGINRSALQPDRFGHREILLAKTTCHILSYN